MADIDDLLNPVGPAEEPGGTDLTDDSAEQAADAHPMEGAVRRWGELSALLRASEEAAAALRERKASEVGRLIHHAGSTTLAPEQVAAVLRDAGLPPDVAAGASDPDAVRRAAEKHFPGARPAVQITALAFEQGEVRLTVTTGSPDQDKVTEVRRDTAHVWGAMTGWRVMERGRGGSLVVASDPQAATRVATARMLREMPRAVAWLVTGQKAAWQGHGPKDDVRLAASQFGYFVQQFGAAPSVLERTKGWRASMQEAGLLDAERQPDGTTRYGCPATLRVAIYGETAALVVRTKPRVTLAQWERAQEILGTLLGVQGLRISSPAAGEIWLAPPAKKRSAAGYVPTERELLHIAPAGRIKADDPIARAQRRVVAMSAAQLAYEETRWTLGRTVEGEVLSQRVKVAPYVLAAGVPGSGKTYWVAWLATSLLAAGGDVVICDGKEGGDYDELAMDLPNVRTLTKSMVGHVAAINWVYAEMQVRYATITRAKREGKEPLSFRPLYLVIDEYAAVKASMRSQKAHALSADVDEVDTMITQLLRKARACRIHLVLVSQEIYADTLPGDQLGLIPVRVLLGPVKPGSVTIQKVAGEALDEAKRLTATTTLEDKGQGVVMTVSDDAEPVPKKIATPYGWAPRREVIEKGHTPSKIIAQWCEVRDKAYRTLVPMSPRMGLVFDWPVELMDRGKKARPPQDWTEYGLHEIRQLPWVQVGRFEDEVPPVNTDRYDIVSPAYGGGEMQSSGTLYH